MSFFSELKKNKIFLISFILIAISYILRIILISVSTLIDDEAYYALWTKHLPIGFFDHGAGIAFFMKPTIMLFGENGFGARSSSIIAMIITSIFMYKFCKKHKDETTAIITVIIFNVTPFFAGLALIVTVDTPMFFFLILAAMAYYEACFYDKKYFYLAGFLIGFATLSKVSALLMGASIVIFILLSSRRKIILKSKEFYLSFVVAFIVYLPFVINVFQSNFAPIKYILDRLEKGGSLKKALELWGAQLGLLGIFFFILFLYVIIYYIVNFIRKKTSEKDMYFALISFIPFLYLLQKSFKNKLEVNWPLFMYIGGIFLVGFFIAKHWKKKSIRILFLINVIFCSIIIFFAISNYFYKLVHINGDPIDRYFKYNSIRYDLKEYYDENMDKNLRIFGMNYQIPSMINFYLKPDIEAVTLNLGTYHPTVFDFFYDDDEFIATDMYFVGGGAEHLKEYFDEIIPITNFISFRGENEVGHYNLFLCKNYKGNGLDFIYKGSKFEF